ncbi:MAG: hypothetical protein NTY67_04260 [Cyanobacteria bacterium]|nr:hypothetical protein [Cyanobacteriota bacterium]
MPLDPRVLHNVNRPAATRPDCNGPERDQAGGWRSARTTPGAGEAGALEAQTSNASS